MLRISPPVIRAALILLFAFAFWQRTTSLESLPDISGDEVWHAIQITNFVKGEPYKIWTATDLPLSPIHSMLEIPFLLVLEPSLWMVRLPAVITGTLAVVFTYILSRRMFDRVTATMASALLAILPLTIIYSRVSYECSSSPLFGILAIYLAYQLRIKTLTAILPLSYFIHPTTIFLFPELLGIVLARTLTESREDPSRRTGLLVKREAALVSVGAAMSLYTMLRPATQKMSVIFDTGLSGKHDFLLFLSRLEHIFLGDARSFPIRSILFWGILLALHVLGLRRLVRDRKWDRVAMVVSPVICALGLFVMGGSNIIKPAMARYGLSLAVPMILSIACLVRSLLAEPSSPRRLVLRRLEMTALLAVGWAILLGFDLARLNRWAYIPKVPYRAKESPWSFRSEASTPAKQLYHIITKDLGPVPDPTRHDDDTGPARTAILAEDWPRYGPLEWLISVRPDVHVFDYHDLGDIQGPKVERMHRSLLQGGYALCIPEGEMDNLVRIFYPVAMRRQWEIAHPQERYATLFRLNKVVPVPGDYNGDGKTEMAVYRSDTGEWLVPSISAAPMPYGELARRDIPVPGDYNGDGKTDIAIYRTTTGEWFCPALGESPIRYGEPDQDIPVPGDYDGDGKTDFATFRVLTCEWFVKCFSTNPHRINDKRGYTIPVPGDYNGDGKTDFAVFLTDTSKWTIPCLGSLPIVHGVSGRDVPVPHDYDGDGRTDVAIYRPATGEWFLRHSSGDSQRLTLGEQAVDQPAPGDYNGDGKTDIAVYRTSTSEAFVQLENRPLMMAQLGPKGREEIATPLRDAPTTASEVLTAEKPQAENRVK